MRFSSNSETDASELLENLNLSSLLIVVRGSRTILLECFQILEYNLFSYLIMEDSQHGMYHNLLSSDVLQNWTHIKDGRNNKHQQILKSEKIHQKIKQTEIIE